MSKIVITQEKLTNLVNTFDEAFSASQVPMNIDELPCHVSFYRMSYSVMRFTNPTLKLFKYFDEEDKYSFFVCQGGYPKSMLFIKALEEGTALFIEPDCGDKVMLQYGYEISQVYEPPLTGAVEAAGEI